MAQRNILLEGDETLRKKSKEVVNFGERINILLDDMWETMAIADGVGLAAPQVGVLRRVVVIDVTLPDEEDNDDIAEDNSLESDIEVKQTKFELINPVILEKKGETSESEGCLSLPGITGIVKRPEFVKVKAFDRNGKEYIVEGEGLLAKALCHEIDHLEGVLFTDIAESIVQPEAVPG